MKRALLFTPALIPAFFVACGDNDSSATVAGTDAEQSPSSSSMDETESSSAISSSNSAQPSSSDISSSSEAQLSSSEVSSSSETPNTSTTPASSTTDVILSSSDNATSSADSAGSSAESISLKSSSSSAQLSSSTQSSGSKTSSSSTEPSSSSETLVSIETCPNPDIEYGTLTDPRDGKTYRTVKIDGKNWMAENLNYADSVRTPSLLTGTWCYNENDTNCNALGRLYTWGSAIDSVALATEQSLDCGYLKKCRIPDEIQGICPPGWRLPNDGDWNRLLKAAGNNKGSVLKSRCGWANDGNGTDDFGFAALPAGGGNGTDQFTGFGTAAHFWTSSGGAEASSASQITFYDDYSNYVYVGSGLGNKNLVFSVRCIQD